jgi:biotin transport system substrate-specific component
MALYVILGAAGLPIFTAGKSGFVFGPTLGYLVGFIAAAAVVGYFSSRQWDRKWFAVAVGLTLGNAVIYAFGLPVLSAFLGSVGAPNDLQTTLDFGLNPFWLGDTIKIALVSTLLPSAWALAKKLKG